MTSFADIETAPARLAPRRRMALKRIGGEALKSARKALGKYGLGEAAIIENWGEMVGPRWAGLTLPQHLNRRSATLTIRVAGAVALELAHVEPQIVERINTFCGRALVARIKIVQGPLPRAAPRRPPPRRLTDAEEEHLAARGAPITDPQLRAALLDFGRAVLERS
jgi:hypothetical protein